MSQTPAAPLPEKTPSPVNHHPAGFVGARHDQLALRPVHFSRVDAPAELWPPARWDVNAREWLVDREHRPLLSRLAQAAGLTILPEARRLAGLPPGDPVLRPDLVPQTAWCSNLRNHLPKPVWDSISRRLRDEAGSRCELCGRRGPAWPTECHEWWSYDETTAIQTLESLKALCPMCHEANHFGLAEIRGRLTEATNHLATVKRLDRGAGRGGTTGRVDHVGPPIPEALDVDLRPPGGVRNRAADPRGRRHPGRGCARTNGATADR